jgi:hypothetical protein
MLYKLELSLQMLQQSLTKRVQASYVVFDRWFISSAFLLEIRSLGLQAIGRLKSDAVCYLYQENWFTVIQFYRLKKADLFYNQDLPYSRQLLP